MEIKLTRTHRGGVNVDLYDEKGRPLECYIANTVAAALVVTESLLKGEDPPRHYNRDFGMEKNIDEINKKRTRVNKVCICRGPE